MSKAKDGDTVKVHYTGTLENGEVFDTSQEREPLEFQLGEGQLIPGFENAVIGMSEGDSTTVDIPIKDEELILDANHPLAGKNLTFEIELLEVV